MQNFAKMEKADFDPFRANFCTMRVQIGAVIDLLNVIWTLGVIFVVEIQIGN